MQMFGTMVQRDASMAVDVAIKVTVGGIGVARRQDKVRDWKVRYLLVGEQEDCSGFG